MWTFFVIYTGFGCPIHVEKRKSLNSSLPASAQGLPSQKMAQSTACTGSSTPRLRSLCTDTSSPDRWSSSSHIMKCVELVDGDHSELRPFVPCPHPDPKAILRVAGFPCSCAVLHPEHPYLRAHVRLVVAAGVHLRVCQIIGEWAGVQPQKS